MNLRQFSALFISLFLVCVVVVVFQYVRSSSVPPTDGSSNPGQQGLSAPLAAKNVSPSEQDLELPRQSNTKRPSTLSTEIMQVEICDNGSCLIDGRDFDSLQDGIAWVEKMEYRLGCDIRIEYCSKRYSPPDDVITKFYKLAVLRNVNLYERGAIGGGTLDLSSTNSNSWPSSRDVIVVERKKQED